MAIAGNCTICEIDKTGYAREQITYSFTETWMKDNVVSCLSSSKAPQTSKTYRGAIWETLGSPELNVIADKNSNLFNGRFVNAIQPKIHLTRSIDRASSCINICERIFR